jgi:hypothetical protein
MIGNCGLEMGSWQRNSIPDMPSMMLREAEGCQPTADEQRCLAPIQ